MKKLFNVDIKLTMTVLASDIKNAVAVAHNNIRNADGELASATYVIREITNINMINEPESLPWGDDVHGERTCMQVFQEQSK